MLRTIIKISALILVIVISSYFFYEIKAADNNLAYKLKGKILLQVEQSGEAWYVNPENEERYYIGRPIDAFNLMKELGIGITNKDLEKISVEFINVGGDDFDQDGLSDIFEDAIGTNRDNKDTDGDGHEDMVEIFYGYNANGEGNVITDNNFANDCKGKIFLQVENHGEAWYVYPDNSKRYFLGRPVDAFNIMRILGLGIKDNDLEKIKINIDITEMPTYNQEESQDNNQQCVDCVQEENLTQEPEEVDNTESQEENNQDSEEEEEITVVGGITNCNSNIDCFYEKFKNCEKAILTLKILDNLEYYYEILGPEGCLCKVKSMYTKMPNPDWLNKEMICLYDYSKDFEDVAQDNSNCSGPLYELMNED